MYLHHVLDVWFETELEPSLQGKGILVRYADDFVIGLERPEEAEPVLSLLAERLAAFGLELHPDKSRLVDFRRPSGGHRKGKGPGTFDLLGFTHYWRCSRRGRWYMTTKTSRSRQRRAIKSVYTWCRRHRHQSVPAQHQALRRKLNGHYNYFNVRGNSVAIRRLAHYARRAW